MIFPKKRSSSLRPRDDGPIYLTAEGVKRLQKRLSLIKASLPKLITETKRTAAYGDRSDNAEYKETKSLLRKAHRQILAAENQLKRAVIIKSGRNASGTAQIGSIVTLESKEGARREFQILGPHETNPEKGRVSYQSPLGAALINRAEGDDVEIQTISGTKKYRIIKIK